PDVFSPMSSALFLLMSILKLDTNERADGCPQWVASAFTQLDSKSLWLYPNRVPLEEKLARKFGLEPSQVLVTNGGDEGIALLARLIRNQNRRVLIPLPAFSIYFKCLGEVSAEIATTPALPNLGIDYPCLIKTLQEGTFGWLILTSPNNPTGEVIPRPVLLELLQIAAQKGVFVLLDEAYVDFYPENAAGLLAEFSNLVLLRTFSKAYGLAGLRVGFLLGASELMNQVRALTLPYNVGTPALHLASAGLESEAEADTLAYCRQIMRNRKQFQNWLQGRDIEVFDSGANFLMIRLSPERARQCRDSLREQGIIVRLFDDPLLAGCIRITIPLDLERLTTALADASLFRRP
ncbi:MAG TPA: histidinol-phosphate transaminase, partial [Acidobacteriota bacterium]|nr:histidinol-phosphate transaminase [Acidobacteriota bacterium]